MLQLRPLTDRIGAEVIGVDINGPISAAVFDQIYEAWLEATILLFRDQKTTPEGQIAFTKRFGEIIAYYDPSEKAVPGHGEILLLTNLTEQGKPSAKHSSAYGWHIDGHYLPQPPSATVLNAIEVPPSGGDTWFSNIQAAYESLPAPMQLRLDGLKVIISRVQARGYVFPEKGPVTAEQRAAWPDIAQPLVRTHPVSGRKSLYVGSIVPWRIAGMDEEESAPLITQLQALCVQPEFVYQHRWRSGDVMLWDNISSMHRATPFDVANDRRIMHRTTVAGGVPA